MTDAPRERVDEHGRTWRICIGGVQTQDSPTGVCEKEFEPPKSDPGRTRCSHCFYALNGRPDRRPVEDRPMAIAPKVCSACGGSFIPVDEDGRCSPCRTLVHVEGDGGAAQLLEVLEVDARPDPEDEKRVPLFRRLSKTDCLEYAAELAADMETGFYIPEGATQPWEKRRFNISEILRRMGYGKWYVAKSFRPAWWPEGGTSAFKNYVDWKIRSRALVGRVTYDQMVPYIEALTFMGFAEMARRIQIDPKDISFRDLSQFTMRAVEMTKAANPFAGEQISEKGSDAYTRMTIAIESVGDDQARAQIFALLDESIGKAREKVRRVVDVLPARTA